MVFILKEKYEIMLYLCDINIIRVLKFGIKKWNLWVKA